MESVDEWQVWIIDLLLANGINNILQEETIKERAGRHFDSNFYAAMKMLKEEGLVTLIETKGKVWYGITLEDAERARNRSKELAIRIKNAVPSDIVQPYIPEPKGFVYLGGPRGVRKFKGQNIYDIFHKRNDRKCYAVRIISNSKKKYQNIHLGSMSEHSSVITKAWKIIQEFGNKGEGTFTLQNLVDRDSKIFSTNKQRGHAILEVLLFEKLIFVYEVNGISPKYALTGKKPYGTTLEKFLDIETATVGDEVDFPETLDEINPAEEVKAPDGDKKPPKTDSKQYSIVSQSCAAS